MDGELRRAASAGALRDVDLGANHPLTGPVAVRGARPGDVLVVELLALDPDAVGSTAVIPGFGLLSDRFPEPLLVRWDIADGVARSEALPGVAIAGRPFLGAVAVAPSAELLARATAREAALGAAALPPDPRGAVPHGAIGREGLRTIPPRENGGNLDIRQLTVGSRLHLPVHVDGALLSLGDAHFAQGDGESCGTAIEVAATARVRVTLRGAGEPGFRSAMPAYEYLEEARPGAAALDRDDRDPGRRRRSERRHGRAAGRAQRAVRARRLDRGRAGPDARGRLRAGERRRATCASARS